MLFLHGLQRVSAARAGYRSSRLFFSSSSLGGFHGLGRAEAAAWIKSLARVGPPETAELIHAAAVISGLARHTMVCNSLMNLYCHHGRLDDAFKLFHAMSAPDVVSWNTALSGLPRGDAALRFAAAMARAGVAFDAVTFATALASSSEIAGGDFLFALQLHARVVKAGFGEDTFVGNALISAYAKAGDMGGAAKAFEGMRHRDLVSWNALISGHAQADEEGSWARAGELFSAMTREEGLGGPDHVSLASAIAACGHERSLRLGRQLHAVAAKKRLDRGAASVANVLMSMYAKCGSAGCAKLAFRLAERKNVVSWTTMISMSAAVELPAMLLFREMRRAGVEPNAVTFVAVLSALAAGTEVVHGLCFKAKALDSVGVCNSLLSAYAKSCMGAARRVLDEMGSAADAVSWNSLIAGYAKKGMVAEALAALSGRRPNEFAVGSVVAAAGFASLGVQCHGLAVKAGLERGEHLAGALVDMYSKSGAAEAAVKVFEGAERRSVVSWTAVISAEARRGNYAGVAARYAEMAAAGVAADGLTELAVLTACGHGGMVEWGLQLFAGMPSRGAEHYAAVVDMLGRAGRVEEAERLAAAAPGKSALQSLLAACRVHGRAEMAARAAAGLLRAAAGEGEGEAGTFVLLSNVYAEKGEWEKVAQVRKAMRDSGVKKEVGFSWVDCGAAGVHRFSSADNTHPQADQVHRTARFLGFHLRPPPPRL
ncbi:pentatricopeptide repeat (PPR) superfamily protein [Wolffia australiana]